MPALTVHNTQVIPSTIDRVYASVRSFRDWARWCPWIAIQSDCERHFLQDGGGFAWEGAVSGEARIEVMREDVPRSLRLKMQRLKPWKWAGELEFAFRDLGAGQGIEVTWTVEGATPYGRIRDAEKAAALLRREIDLGLALLQGFVETGAAPCKLECPGRVFFPGGFYLGVRWKGPLAEIATAVPTSVGKLTEWMKAKKLAALGPQTTFCRKWDYDKGECEITIARLVGEGTVKVGLPRGFVTFDVPFGKAELVRLTGPYHYLPLAWSSAKARIEAFDFEPVSSPEPFEVYENNPSTVPPSRLSTAVYVPVK